jgi:hypothetical protein
MTTDEHRLMILMFTRLYGAIDTISEALIRRGIWSAEEKAALSQRLHEDDAKAIEYLHRATSDYLGAATGVGVETGAKIEPPN